MEPGYKKNDDLEKVIDNESDELTLIELDGEYFEVIDTANIDGKNYVALLPYSEEDPDPGEEGKFTVLEIIDDPDDEESCTLRTIDDTELYDRIGDEFMKAFAQYDEDDE